MEKISYIDFIIVMLKEKNTQNNAEKLVFPKLC